MDFPTSQPDVGLVGGVFVDENPATGQPGSRIPASWGNQVTQEIKAVIEAAAIAPSDQASDQLVEAIQKLIAESTADTGGMPRFTAYLWTGRGDAMPEGDTQSSGQQLLDLMYPDMRADVVATQFTCTEAEWQADPYKRVTHWSLGDGVSWMRPPDKNGVQPGNVGSFYGAGSNPAGAKTGTAVIDAMRNIRGQAPYVMAVNDAAPASGAFKWEFKRNFAAQQINAPGYDQLNFDASAALPAGTTTDPITGEFRPRTWYGIWMIRMYGRVVNPGALDAPALNARMDMLDARASALEAPRVWRTVTGSRAPLTTYWNLSGSEMELAIYISDPGVAISGNKGIFVDGDLKNKIFIDFIASPGAGQVSGITLTATVPNGASYSVDFSGNAIGFWKELSK